MNKDIRRKNRAVTDFNQMMKIIDQAKILHLGLLDHGFPYIVPLHYGYEYDGNTDAFIFYLHGAKAGHKIDLIRDNPNVCIELETDVELDPVNDVPCQYSSFYSSVIGQGFASLVDAMWKRKNGR